MRTFTAARLTAVAATPVVAACASPTLPIDPAWRTLCARDDGLDAVLHGSSSDPRVAWAIDSQTGRRIELVWPPGYHATFDPDLTILRAGGSIAAREGHLITGGCSEVDHPEAPTWVSSAEISRQ